MPRYPLLAAAATGPRQGLWSVLVVAAFTVSAVAWASAPMYDEASENAAFTARRAAVPETAYQDEDAVVRLTASTSPRSEDQRSVLADLRGIPHLSELVAGRRAHDVRDWGQVSLLPQRLALAAELTLAENALRPAVAVLDEPTGHQDDDHVELVLDALTAAVRAGTLVLVATHDPRIIDIADVTIAIHSGRVDPPLPPVSADPDAPTAHRPG